MNSTAERRRIDSHRKSYWKTSSTAFLVVIAGGLLTYALPMLLQPPWSHAVVTAIFLICAPSVVVFAGGLLVLRRDALDARGAPDLFYTEFSRAHHCNAKGWRRSIRPLFGTMLRPGDVVMVRDAAEIGATLDARARLDNLPFMPEMLAYCGRTFLVDRRVDKINDWIGGNEIRRVRNVVTLVDTRCNGAGHGGCQAACQILWHDKWLRPVPRLPHQVNQDYSVVTTLHAHPSSMESAAFAAIHREATRQEVSQEAKTTTKYTCQITELLCSSTTMAKWDIRQDLRPLFSGNIGLIGFFVAVLTSTFNRAQSLRGGIRYPVMPRQLDSGPTPTQNLTLQAGETVRVRNKGDIALTLFRNHNRGMWFGNETMRHCGRRYTVLSRIDRIIDERSGEMRTLSTPGIILDRVTATGEFLRFCPQNEYVFWREIWLERVAHSNSHCTKSAG